MLFFKTTREVTIVIDPKLRRQLQLARIHELHTLRWNERRIELIKALLVARVEGNQANIAHVRDSLCEHKLSRFDTKETLRELGVSEEEHVKASPHSREVEDRLAYMRIRAREVVRRSCNWRTEEIIILEFGNRIQDIESQLSFWKARRKIFAIIVGGLALYPDYAFDLKGRFRPHPALAIVMRILSEKKDNWGMAYWFASPNGWLGGSRPQDVLADDPAGVIAAAQVEANGIMHG